MITGKQRSKLKAIAQTLSVAVSIGKGGLTENIIRAIDNNLNANEIVKVSLQEGSGLEPKAICNQIAEQLNAEFVQAIGRRFVLYRKAKDKDKRKILL
ncbi:MAG: YhbY family RNA-binding protein [Eubacterium sp.]|nr:YhbY family RNA-binding protein [Eubacterium sp.]